MALGASVVTISATNNRANASLLLIYRTDPFPYTAREAMGDSLGFFYYRHRVLDPTTGRFTSEDPLGFVDGANRYVYCRNDPVSFIDPFGLEDINLYGPVTIARAASDLRKSGANEITVGGHGVCGDVIDLRTGRAQVITP